MKASRSILKPRGQRSWAFMLFRILVVSALAYLFRLHIASFGAYVHNAAWRALTGSEENHEGDIRGLLQCGAPGARLLVKMGESEALTNAVDPSQIPTLLRLAREHGDPKVRSHAFQGLGRFQDERVRELAVQALTSEDVYTRREGVRLMLMLGDERDLPQLRAALEKEEEPSLRRLMAAAVESIAPTDRQFEKTVLVAAIQFMSQFGEPEDNMARLGPLIRQAAEKGAKIIVVPETAIQGYMTHDIKCGWKREDWETTSGIRGVPVQSVAQPVPGPITEWFSKLAMELKVYITAPVLEKEEETERFFNSLCLVGPDGGLLLHYRKCTPWPYAEKGWASLGDRGVPCVDTEYGRLAVLICYDMNFEPERLQGQGVDTVLYSIAWVEGPKSPWFSTRLPQIAKERDFNIIGANWTVPSKPQWYGYGQTRIMDRNGRIVAQAANDLQEEIVLGEIPY